MKNWVIALLLGILVAFGGNQISYAQELDPGQLIEEVEDTIDRTTDNVTGGNDEKPRPRPNPRPRPAPDNNAGSSGDRPRGTNNSGGTSSGGSGGSDRGTGGGSNQPANNRPTRQEDKDRKPSESPSPSPSATPRVVERIIYKGIALRDLILIAVFGLTGVTVGFILIRRRV